MSLISEFCLIFIRFSVRNLDQEIQGNVLRFRGVLDFGGFV